MKNISQLQYDNTTGQYYEGLSILEYIVKDTNVEENKDTLDDLYNILYGNKL